MSKSENQKLKPLVLMEILRMHSDEDHPLSTNKIIQMLSEYGIETGRKALYDDIRLLNSYGYEVLCQKAKTNLYYVVDRKFDVAELRLLMDAVQSANTITEKKTAELTSKIADLAGFNRAQILRKNVVFADTAKHSNESIFYTIDTIDRALNEGKKVSFVYFDLDSHGDRAYRKNGDRYVVNPVAMVFNDGRYYLTAYNDKYLNLSNYRIDRMDKAEMLEETRTPADCVKDFNVNKHRKQAFSMFVGELTRVTFAINKSVLDVIFDKFGEKTKFIAIDENTYKFSAQVQVSKAFFGWLAGLGGNIKIIAPTPVASDYVKYLSEIVSAYNQSDD